MRYVRFGLRISNYTIYIHILTKILPYTKIFLFYCLFYVRHSGIAVHSRSDISLGVLIMKYIRMSFLQGTYK